MCGKVSIIMPVYNTGKYIRDSIESVISQTYQNWELIMIDDGSTDESSTIIQSYNDNRIVYVRNESRVGAAFSRNRGLKMATGKWIAFLDSDDIWKSTKLKKQLEFMVKNNSAFSFTDYRIELNGVWNKYVNIGPKRVNYQKILRYCYFSTITVIYDREKVGLIQIANLKKNNDYAMWLMALNKVTAERYPECLSFYIKHDESVSSGSKLKLIKYHYLLFKQGMKMNSVKSLLFTIRNVFYGSLKRIVYRRKANIFDMPDTKRVA